MDQDKSVQQMQALGARLMNTPGLPAAMVAGARSMPKATGKFNDERDAIIFDLQRQLEGERDKNRCLEDQFKYRVASFVKRETSTKNKIDSLERRLNEGADTDEHMQRMDRIQNMHKTVVGSIESIQTNTTGILQNQEKDLMRSFRARLCEVTKELEAHRSKKGEHSTELQARHRRVVAELREAQELAQTFDKKNQELQRENQKLRDSMSTRADDRQELLKELVVAKKDNAKLKAQVKGDTLSARGMQESNDEASRDRNDIAAKSRPPRQMDASKLLKCRNQQYEKEVQYREAASKLKRLVEAERKQLRALRQQQTDMLQQRTELEILLKQCLEDVVSEIQRHNQAETPGEDGRPATSEDMTVHELSAQDRERVLELLFSQERVVQLLYNKTFATEPGEESEDARVQSADSKPPVDDFAWLGDIVPPEEL